MSDTTDSGNNFGGFGGIGDLPGKTAASKISYMSALSKMIGVDPASLYGGTMDASAPFTPPDFVDPGNPVASAYGKQPAFATLFQSMTKDGLDPANAYAQFKTANPTGIFDYAVPSDVTAARKIFQDYANHESDRTLARSKYEADVNKLRGEHDAKIKNNDATGVSTHYNDAKARVGGDFGAQDVIKAYASQYGAKLMGDTQGPPPSPYQHFSDPRQQALYDYGVEHGAQGAVDLSKMTATRSTQGADVANRLLALLKVSGRG